MKSSKQELIYASSSKLVEFMFLSLLLNHLLYSYLMGYEVSKVIDERRKHIKVDNVRLTR